MKLDYSPTHLYIAFSREYPGNKYNNSFSSIYYYSSYSSKKVCI